MKFFLLTHFIIILPPLHDPIFTVLGSHDLQTF